MMAWQPTFCCGKGVGYLALPLPHTPKFEITASQIVEWVNVLGDDV